MLKKPYTAPLIRPMIVMPPMHHVTVYEFMADLAEWYLPDLCALHGLLCKAHQSHVHVPVLIGMVESNIERALKKVN